MYTGLIDVQLTPLLSSRSSVFSLPCTAEGAVIPEHTIHSFILSSNTQYPMQNIRCAAADSQWQSSKLPRPEHSCPQTYIGPRHLSHHMSNNGSSRHGSAYLYDSVSMLCRVLVGAHSMALVKSASI